MRITNPDGTKTIYTATSTAEKSVSIFVGFEDDETRNQFLIAIKIIDGAGHETNGFSRATGKLTAFGYPPEDFDYELIELYKDEKLLWEESGNYNINWIYDNGNTISDATSIPGHLTIENQTVITSSDFEIFKIQVK